MLNNRTALVTGGSRGIGRAIALKLAEAGCNVAVIYSGSAEGAGETCAKARTFGVNAVAYQCDVADYAKVKETCARVLDDLGSVDILVNNAGITRDNLILRMSEDEFDRVIDVNLKGAFNFIQVLSKTLMRSPAGRIINIASVSGLMGNAGQANYSAAKAGMVGLSKTIAKELAPRKVTCNAIAPGFIETEMTEHLPQSVKDYAETAVPLKRMGTPEEVAALVLFLASDQAAYITGEVIRVDGGMCM